MPECGISAKKVSGNELRQPKREATWAENNKAVGVGFPSPLELTQQCHVPRVPDMELQDLVFALLGFSLAVV
jgi:hypothetical protein